MAANLGSFVGEWKGRNFSHVSIRPAGSSLDIAFNHTVVRGKGINIRMEGNLLKWTLKLDNPDPPRFTDCDFTYDLTGSDEIFATWTDRNNGNWKVILNRVGPAPIAKIETAKEPPSKREAVPAEGKVKEAEKTIQAQFAEEYAKAKKSPAERLSLAAKLLETGRDTRDDPTARFALYREARDLALQAAQWSVAAEVIDQMQQDFDVDPLAVREQSLQILAKQTPIPLESAKEAVEAAIASIGECITADKVDGAAKFLDIANGFAARTKIASLIDQTKKQETELKALQQDFNKCKIAVEKLKASPDDKDAALEAGRYLALRKGDWNAGLALLAKADDKTLTALAKKDVESPQDTKAMKELGDEWFALGEKEKDRWLQAAYRQRAGHWYRQALPATTGLSLKTLETSLKAIDDAPSPFKVSMDATIRQFKAHVGPVHALLMWPDGKRFSTGGADGKVRTWGMQADKSSPPELSMGKAVHSLVLSPGKNWLAVATKERSFIFALPGLQPTNKEGEQSVPGTFFSDPARSYRVMGDMFGSSDLPPRSSGAGPLQGPPPSAIVAAPDGSSFIGFSSPPQHYRVGSGGGQSRGMTLQESPNALAAAYTGDGKTVAVASSDKKIRIYNLNQGKLISTLPIELSGVRALAFTPAGDRLLIGGDDRTIHVWSIATSKELAKLVGHTGTVHSIVTTPDGRQALSGGNEGVVRLWALPREKKQ